MNILIADDEPLVHKSIEFNLQRLIMKDDRILHAYNSNDMESIFRNHAIDIALVDIRMPGRDGLTMIKEEKKEHPDTDFYVISGFNEFEYARSALRLGITDYFIKPVSPKDLQSMLTHARTLKEKKDSQVREKFQFWLLNSLHQIIVSSNIPKDYDMLLCLETSELSKHLSIPYYAEDWVKDVSSPFPDGLAMVFFSTSPESLMVLRRKILEIPPETGNTIFLSRILEDEATAYFTMQNLLDAASLRPIIGIESTYQITEKSEYSFSIRNISALLLNLKKYYLTKDYCNFALVCERLKNQLSSLDAKQIDNVAKYISSSFSVRVEGTDKAIFSELEVKEKEIFQSANDDNKRTEIIMEYIDKNYCKDISLMDVSTVFHLSPNYISSLLKSEKGIKFSNYVQQLRLNHAKILLLSGHSVKEVAELVGYHSQSHFTKIFYEAEKVTPLEYKRNHLGNIHDDP